QYLFYNGQLFFFAPYRILSRHGCTLLFFILTQKDGRHFRVYHLFTISPKGSGVFSFAGKRWMQKEWTVSNGSGKIPICRANEKISACAVTFPSLAASMK
ncbi:hypothetical protein, partial [Oscillibacter ruminantium]